MTKSIFTPTYHIFLKLLIQLRQEKNMTQAALAQELRKPQSYVSKYESGERRLDVIETMDILRALKIPFLSFCEKLEKNLK